MAHHKANSLQSAAVTSEFLGALVQCIHAVRSDGYLLDISLEGLPQDSPLHGELAALLKPEVPDDGDAGKGGENPKSEIPNPKS